MIIHRVFALLAAVSMAGPMGAKGEFSKPKAAHFSPGERTAFKAAKENPARCWEVHGGTFCQFPDGGSYKQFCFPDVWPGSSGKAFDAGNTRNCVKPAIVKKLMGPPPTE